MSADKRRTMPDDKTTLELPITGMTCASCVARNERALRKLDGVDEANVNFATEKATVVFDPAVLTRRATSSTTVEKAGYGVVTRTRDPADPRHDLRQLRRPRRARLAEDAGRARRRRSTWRPRRRPSRTCPGRPTTPPSSPPCAPRATTSVEAPRRRGAAGGARRRGRSPSPRSTSSRRRRAAAYRALRRKVIVGFVLSTIIFVGHDAAALVHLPARLAAQRLRAVGARDAGAVLGGLAVLHRGLGGPAARLQHEHEHAHRHGLLGGLPLQRRRRALPGGVRARRPRRADVLRLRRLHHHADPLRAPARGARQGPDRRGGAQAHRPAAAHGARGARRRRDRRADRRRRRRRPRARAPRREGPGRRRSSSRAARRSTSRC